MTRSKSSACGSSSQLVSPMPCAPIASPRPVLGAAGAVGGCMSELRIARTMSAGGEHCRGVARSPGLPAVVESPECAVESDAVEVVGRSGGVAADAGGVEAFLVSVGGEVPRCLTAHDVAALWSCRSSRASTLFSLQKMSWVSQACAASGQMRSAGVGKCATWSPAGWGLAGDGPGVLGVSGGAGGGDEDGGRAGDEVRDGEGILGAAASPERVRTHDGESEGAGGERVRHLDLPPL